MSAYGVRRTALVLPALAHEVRERVAQRGVVEIVEQALRHRRGLFAADAFGKVGRERGII